MILSVSRRTDVPNYYSDWFFNRIKEGYLYVRNPINIHQISKINLSPDIVDCIVFWTKNPANMIERLDELKDYKYYFQFTLTGYGKDVEPNIPNKRSELISTFKKLSEKAGKDKVIWRYDPILISARYTTDYHLKAFEEIIDNLAGYTDKVVISFVDLYSKTQRNTEGLNIETVTNEDIYTLAEKLAGIAERYQIEIETCAEQIELQNVGIKHGSCIDKKLIEKILGCKLIVGKDKNQREECGCFESVEVGTYNTCSNGCKYCYANFNDERVKESVKLYNVDSPLLCGKVGANDKITDRKVKSLKDTQISFF
ncbi:MAG: DUF1848 domain-containing protein [Ruminococcus sp.]|nr:DUF1848 domain-containing protein [Ruminococcus sp.]